jgi:hypothetical protein
MSACGPISVNRRPSGRQVRPARRLAKLGGEGLSRGCCGRLSERALLDCLAAIRAHPERRRARALLWFAERTARLARRALPSKLSRDGRRPRPLNNAPAGRPEAQGRQKKSSGDDAREALSSGTAPGRLSGCGPASHFTFVSGIFARWPRVVRAPLFVRSAQGPLKLPIFRRIFLSYQFNWWVHKDSNLGPAE